MKKPERDYKKEYAAWTPQQIANNKKRQKARVALGLKKGDKRECDHIIPLSKGGSNLKKNTKIMSRTANRKKGNTLPKKKGK